MKKISIIITIIILCTGCTTMKTYDQWAQTFADNLETEHDPVRVVEAYNNEYICPKDAENTYKKGLFGLGTKKDYQCIKRDTLMEPDIKLNCTLTDGYEYSGKTFKDNSDECILYRRSDKFHKSEVDYFDYKRFLGKNSLIKNDNDFLKLVKHYEKIAECDAVSETTKAEKEACKEKRRNEIRSLATRKVSCSELINTKYTEFLKTQGDWFNWAINHDPYENVRLMRALGEYEASHWMYAPVFTRSEARATVKEYIQDFGKENFCTTGDWETKLEKLGYDL